MNINWKVRIHNPVLRVNIATAAVLPILAYFGLNWEDITTWAAFGNIFVQAVKNPVVVAAVIASVWNALNDPTTQGLSDSTRALAYTKPFPSKK